MENVQIVLQLMLYGVKDSIVGGALAVKYFWSKRKNIRKVEPKKTSSRQPRDSKTVLDVLTQCIVFGALYWLAIFVYHNYLLKHYNDYLASFLTSEEQQTMSWLPITQSIMFTFTWTLPLFFIRGILNFSWYQEIADMTYDHTGIKKKNTQSMSYSWSDQITSTAVQFLFLIQGYILFLFPVSRPIQEIFCIWHLSLLYALYAFEYKWVQIGWPLRKRLVYIDSKWPYFVGFGLPLAILTSYIGSYIESICIFSTLFPFYVMSSTITFSTQLQSFNYPLRSFGIVSFISDFVICRLCNILHQVLGR